MQISIHNIPSKEELAPLLEEATKEQSAQEFVSEYLSSVKDMLAGDPSMYKTYGMWWWAIKDLLRAEGYDLGEETDPAIAQVFNYDDPALLCAAAYLYQSQRLNQAFLWSAEHEYEGGGDQISYLLCDSDMVKPFNF